MTTIIGNIAVVIGLVSVVSALIYVNKTINTTRGTQWPGITYIALVIAYAAVQFS